MPYTLEASELGVVEVVFSGEMTFDEAKTSRVETAALMKSRGLLAVLIDMSQTVSHNPGTYDVFEFNASHYDVFPLGTRMAVVIPPMKELQEPAAFGETVAQNRGILMRIFLERDEAMTWLRSIATAED